MKIITFSSQTLQASICSLKSSKASIEDQINFFKNAAQNDAIYYSAAGLLEQQLYSIEAALAELQTAYTQMLDDLSERSETNSYSKPSYTMEEIKDTAAISKYRIPVGIVEVTKDT